MFLELSAKGVHAVNFLLDFGLALVDESTDITPPVGMAVVLEGLCFVLGLVTQGGRLGAAVAYAHLSLFSDDYK